MLKAETAGDRLQFERANDACRKRSGISTLSLERSLMHWNWSRRCARRASLVPQPASKNLILLRRAVAERFGPIARHVITSDRRFELAHGEVDPPAIDQVVVPGVVTLVLRISPPSRSCTTSAVTPHWPDAGLSAFQWRPVSLDQARRSRRYSPTRDSLPAVIGVPAPQATSG